MTTMATITPDEARQKAAEIEFLLQGATEPVSKAILEQARDLWIALAKEGDNAGRIDLSPEHDRLLALLDAYKERSNEAQ
jgi:hypothetical protein